MKVGGYVKLRIELGGFTVGLVYKIQDVLSDVSFCVGLCNDDNQIIYFRVSELKLLDNTKPLKNKTPEHYKTNSIDVIDFAKIYNLNFNLGNIVKYVCRDKGTDIEDLEKVIDYAQREIKHLKSLDK